MTQMNTFVAVNSIVWAQVTVYIRHRHPIDYVFTI